MFDKQVNSATMAAVDNCHPVRELTEPDPEIMTILLGHDRVPGFEFPIHESYPTVVLSKATCADHILWVEDSYIAGKKGQTYGFLVDKLWPWLSEALGRYFLADGWTVKDWVFTSPGGRDIPYVPGFRIVDNAPVIPDGVDLDEVTTKFKLNRGRVNTYVTHVFSTQDEGSKSLPSNVEETQEMMYNMTVPRGLIKAATDMVYPGQNNLSQKQERQALTAWLCIKLQTPIMVFDSPFSFPK